MRSFFRWTGALVMIGIYVACSPKQFAKDPDYMPCQNSGQNCVSENGRDYFTHTETVEGGKVDVLIVNDNSASMSYEQERMATAFNNFIQNLDTKKMNYRIGVTTTDISSAGNPARAVNQNGALQDGKLIPFKLLSNAPFLAKDSGTFSQKDSAFKDVIKREETLKCEDFILGWSGSKETAAYSNKYTEKCPSGDERGIYAANLVIENNPSSFIRPEASLAVIVLSDEDERSQLYYYNNKNFLLESLDKASTFISKMASKYPNKKYRVHSIITKDASCLSTQNAQTGGIVNGSYGLEYASLTNQTGGVQGDICAPNYTSQLQSIFNNIQGQIVDKVALACATPSDLAVVLTNNSDPSISWSVVDKEVRFNKKLPIGTNVKVTYSCESL